MKALRGKGSQKAAQRIRQSRFMLLMTAHGLPGPFLEYRFHGERLWKFDYAWPHVRVAVEEEGGAFTTVKGRHVRGAGFREDLEKYNAATVMGWKVLRFLPEQIQSGKCVPEIKLLLAAEKRRQ